MWDYRTPSDEWIYLYTADDERAWSYKTDNTSLWTLRGPDAKVLREYATQRHLERRRGLHLPRRPPARRRDPGRNPSLPPRPPGNPAPGLEQPRPAGGLPRLLPLRRRSDRLQPGHHPGKFTGHERDLGNPGGTGDDLDYMHARHESEWTGRFLSVDPALESADPKVPQTWNRYSYVASSPLKYLDPTGEILKLFWDD